MWILKKANKLCLKSPFKEQKYYFSKIIGRCECMDVWIYTDNYYVNLSNLKEDPLRALLLKLTHIGRFAQIFPTFPHHTYTKFRLSWKNAQKVGCMVVNSKEFLILQILHYVWYPWKSWGHLQENGKFWSLISFVWERVSELVSVNIFSATWDMRWA